MNMCLCVYIYIYVYVCMWVFILDNMLFVEKKIKYKKI